MPPVVAELHTLELILTAACNLRCSYCYQNAKQNRHIEWDVVRAALDRLLASTCSDVTVVFIGGEPLLEFPTLVRATDYIGEHRRADMQVRHEIYTNGLLLGDRELKFLIEHNFHVQVSFDGVPAAQGLRGEHTFERLNALLDTLRAEHRAFYEDAFNIAITATPRTIHLLADSIEYFLINKRVHDVTIGPQITQTGEWKVERLGELDAAFSRIFSISLRRYSETGDVPLRVFRKNHEGLRPAPTERAMCGAPDGHKFAVDVDGQSHGCLMFAESYQKFPTTFLGSRVDAIRLGDVRDDGFEGRRAAYPAAARATKIFHHQEDKYSSYRRCAECEYLAECSVCPMSLGRVEADVNRVPDFLCAYNLVALKYRAQFPRYRSLGERWLEHVATD